MKIDSKRLKKIINEELASFKEGIDHGGIKDVVTVASKLLAAVELFKVKAPGPAISAVTPHLQSIEKVLEDMVSTPGSYVAKEKVQLKKVSLKPAKESVNEATGDSGPELVDAMNFQHLEVGNTYLVKVGRERVKCVFKGWVDKGGVDTENENPEEVDLRFADVSDGMEWEAYFFDGKYCGGSSADPLYVKEEP